MPPPLFAGSVDVDPSTLGRLAYSRLLVLASPNESGRNGKATERQAADHSSHVLPGCAPAARTMSTSPGDEAFRSQCNSQQAAGLLSLFCCTGLAVSDRWPARYICRHSSSRRGRGDQRDQRFARSDGKTKTFADYGSSCIGPSIALRCACLRTPIRTRHSNVLPDHGRSDTTA